MTNLDAPVKLEERSVVRKGLAGLRRDGFVPAVIHNHGQASVHVMGKELELAKIYKEAGKHHPLQLAVGGQNFLALIKDVHYHPAKRRMQHVVFQAIRQDEKVEAEVPVVMEGEIPAEKAGLMVLRPHDRVEVEALPRDLPDELKIDATKLVELGDKITVADIQVPAGVTILTDPEQPIASVVEAKVEETPEPEAAEGEEAEAAEGEAGPAADNAEAEAAPQDTTQE